MCTGITYTSQCQFNANTFSIRLEKRIAHVGVSIKNESFQFAEKLN